MTRTDVPSATSAEARAWRPVVIAGAGPAGLMLACELGRYGVPTVVLDPLPDVSDQSPGQGLNTSVVELLEQRGLLAGLVDQGIPLQGTHFSLLWLDIAPLAGRHRPGMLLGQERLERHLAETATALGVDLRRGHRVVDQKPVGPGDADGGWVDVSATGPDGAYTLRAGYLVGADGERSGVRERAGIDFRGHGLASYGLAGDVELEAGSELDEVHVGARFSPSGGLYSSTPAPGNALRVVTAEFGRDLPADGSPPDAAELAAAVERLNGSAFPIRAVRWLRRYGGPSRVAAAYRVGRVFLVGDAAHTFYPLAGLRLNLCLGDAVNLGWKLAAAVRGRAPDGLLDSYEAERRPVGERACAMTDAQLALVYPADKVAALRALVGELLAFPDANRHLLEIVTGLETRYPMPAAGTYDDADVLGAGLLGARLPHVPLRTAGSATGVPDLLNAGDGLLLVFGEPGESADLSWPGVEAVLAEPSAQIDAAAVLVRPDGHVAFVAPAGQSIEAEALARAGAPWFGEPARRGSAARRLESVS